MQLSGKHLYEFGPFRLDSAERVLWRANQPVQLTPKVFDLLLVLVENRGRLLGKDELLQKVWPDSFVEEANLSVNISILRRTLGEPGGETQFIETVPRRGYRFIAEVREQPQPGVEPAEMIIAERTRTSVTVEEQLDGQVSEMEASSRVDKKLLARPRASQATILQVSVAVILLSLLALAGYRWQRRQVTEPTAIKTLAVLPFKSLNLKADAKGNDEYLGVGLADVLITRLSNLSQLAVRPTSSVLPFGEKDALQAGQALQVDSVLDGSIQQQGDRVRVTVRLLRTSDGQPLWAYQCDQQCTDVFALQDAISGKVAEALALKLSGDERERLNRRYTANAAAYQEYLQGRYFTLQFSPDGYKKALEHLQRAIDLDQNYALAWAGLADAYTTASEEMLPPREVMPKAVEAARRALALDETLGEAHAALGHALFHTWHYREAEPELKRALELNPNAVPTYIWYGEFYAHTDPPKGIELLKHAQQIDPLSPILYGFLAYISIMANQPELAINSARKAYDLSPDSQAIWLGMTLVSMGIDYKEAETLVMQHLAKERDHFDLSGLATIYAHTGRRAEALSILDELKSLAKKQYFSPYYIATGYAALGEKDEAFAWLEQAYVEQSEYLGTLKHDPLLKNLRDDPRLADLSRRVGLTQ